MSAPSDDSSIHASGLSKRYTLGQYSGYQTLRESISLLSGRFQRAIAGASPAAGAAEKQFWAIKDVSFDISPGESVGLIGRNGAGKSTLLKLLARVTSPSAGTAWLRGRVASLLEVGTGFHPELTGRENIFLNGSILGMPLRDIRDRLDEIVAFSGLEKFLDTPVKRYSSGMYMRLAFSVAAHLDADILLVDEVLAVGDAEFQKKCLGQMDEISRGGRTIIFVSHNLAAVRQLCTRGIVLEYGQLAFDGRIDAAADYYLQRGMSSSAHTWPADRQPGNDVAKMVAVRVDSENQDTSDLAIDRPIRVSVDYRILKPGARINVSIHLRHNDGTCVFATSNLPSMIEGHDPLAGQPLASGDYTASCTIPPLFLNEGLYSITPILVQDASAILASDPDAVTFTVFDTGAMRREYAGLWIGVTRPRLAWTTIQREATGEQGTPSAAIGN